jgi:D-lactate dehydrogenase (cytochrome)
MYSPEEIGVMRAIKHAFDPDDIFNPGKIFPLVPETRLEPSSDRGAERRSIGSPVLKDGVVFSPSSLAEAGDGFAAFSQQKKRVRISGDMQRGAADIVCRTADLDDIIVYDPDELVITVGAGARLDAVQAHIEKDGLRLALASPWKDASLGGLVAANLNSPLRMRYGGIADQLLAMSIVLADGRTIRAGRPVMKNVAGYDLPKLMVGSFGSLGLIADITFKLHVQPGARRTLLAPVADLHQGLDLGLHCLQTAYVASGIALVKGAPLPAGLPMSEFTLVYTAEGLPADVAAELELVQKTMQAAGVSAVDEIGSTSSVGLWAAHLGASQTPFKLRVGVPVKDLDPFLTALEDDLEKYNIFCDIAGGLIYLSLGMGDFDRARTDLGRIRAHALAMDGYAVVMQAPDDWRARIDLWGYSPDAQSIMKALRSLWDSDDVLVSDFSLS